MEKDTQYHQNFIKTSALTHSLCFFNGMCVYTIRNSVYTDCLALFTCEEYCDDETLRD